MIIEGTLNGKGVSHHADGRSQCKAVLSDQMESACHDLEGAADRYTGSLLDFMDLLLLSMGRMTASPLFPAERSISRNEQTSGCHLWSQVSP